MGRDLCSGSSWQETQLCCPAWHWNVPRGHPQPGCSGNGAGLCAEHTCLPALWELSLMSGNPSVSISACRFKCSLCFPSICRWVCSGCHTVVSRLLILCVAVMVSSCSSMNSYHSIIFSTHVFLESAPKKQGEELSGATGSRGEEILWRNSVTTSSQVYYRSMKMKSHQTLNATEIYLGSDANSFISWVYRVFTLFSQNIWHKSPLQLHSETEEPLVVAGFEG